LKAIAHVLFKCQKMLELLSLGKGVDSHFENKRRH